VYQPADDGVLADVQFFSETRDSKVKRRQ